MVQNYTAVITGVGIGTGGGKAPRQILAGVVFGQPSLSCRGHGLCRVELVTNHCWRPIAAKTAIAYAVCEQIPARFRYHQREGLQMIVQQCDLSPGVYEQHFNGPCFLMQESFRLSDVIVAALDLEVPFIARGCYPMQKTAQRIVVDLSSGLDTACQIAH